MAGGSAWLITHPVRRRPDDEDDDHDQAAEAALDRWRDRWVEEEE